MADVADVVAVRLSAMGDLVHALGALQALSRARPQWRVHVAVQREFAPLLLHLPWVTSVVEYDRRPALRGLFASLRRLRRARFAVALDLQGNWKSALAARATGAPRVVGMAAPWRREPASARLLTERVDGGALPRHPAHLALAVVRAVAPDARDVAPALVASDAELARELAALRALGIDGELPFSVFVVGDPKDNRTWPAEFAQRAVEASPWPALALVGPSEPHAVPLPRGAVPLRHAPGELRRLVALGVLLARAKGRAFGPDQGPTHVLAACGAEVTALFGPQEPRSTAPRSARVLVRADAPACAPCRERRCRHVEGPVCMRFAVAEGREARTHE